MAGRHAPTAVDVPTIADLGGEHALPDKGVAGAAFGSGLITAATQRAD